MMKFEQNWADLGSWNSLMELSNNDVKLEKDTKFTITQKILPL